MEADFIVHLTCRNISIPRILSRSDIVRLLSRIVARSAGHDQSESGAVQALVEERSEPRVEVVRAEGAHVFMEGKDDRLLSQRVNRRYENDSRARIRVVVIVPEDDGRVVQGMLVAHDAQRCGTEHEVSRVLRGQARPGGEDTEELAVTEEEDATAIRP